MKRIIPFIVVVLVLAFFSCENEKTEENNSEINLYKSNDDFVVSMSNRSPENSDPFDLKSIIFENNQVKITVGYSGGCKVHTFDIIWDEVITSSNPPGINLIVIHNSNDDMCEAYITETLVFDLKVLLDTLTFETISVGAYNGWDPDGYEEYEGTGYDFTFIESDICNVTVTARYVICGTGLYDNLWFALDDSISAGMADYYFYNYLQPVDINSAITGFTPIPGNKYTIGAKIQKTHNYLGVPICLAYSGPSVPVKIMCIEDLK